MATRLGKFELPNRLRPDEETATDIYAKFIADPFESGYGHTIGNAFRRVRHSPDSRRGGVLTQAAVLTATSNGIRTQPIRRGAFILEEILADHPDVAECAVIGVKDSLKGQVPLGFVVLNAGVPGYGTDQARMSMERLVARTQADAVLLTVYAGNDLRDNDRWGRQEALPDTPPAVLPPPPQRGHQSDLIHW